MGLFLRWTPLPHLVPNSSTASPHVGVLILSDAAKEGDIGDLIRRLGPRRQYRKGHISGVVLVDLSPATEEALAVGAPRGYITITRGAAPRSKESKGSR